MNPYLELILPSLVLPFILSLIWLSLSRRYPVFRWLLPIIWLPSCFWLVGWPKAIPQEANEWLWWLLILSMGLQALWLTRPRLTAWMQTSLLGLALILLAWPVLRYQPSLSLVLELIVVLLTAVTLFFRAESNHTTMPVVALTISSAGLAFITVLGGSVLVGQLAGALASVLGAFALYECYRRWTKQGATPMQLVPVIQIYLALLLIARIYAEIPLGSASLLLLAPLTGFLLASRFAVFGSIASTVAAFGWLLLTTDSSSYY